MLRGQFTVQDAGVKPGLSTFSFSRVLANLRNPDAAEVHNENDFDMLIHVGGQTRLAPPPLNHPLSPQAIANRAGQGRPPFEFI